MHALIDQRAAALSRPARAPAVHVIVVLRAVPIGDGEVGADDLAEPSALDEALRLRVKRIGALVVHDRKNCVPVFVCCAYQLRRVLCRDRDRLFDEGVQSVLQSVFADLDVRIVRRRDDDRLGVSRVDQIAEVGICVDAPFALSLGSDLGIDVADRAELCARHRALGEVVRVVRAHPSYSDHRDSHFVPPLTSVLRRISAATVGRFVVTLATPHAMNRDSRL